MLGPDIFSPPVVNQSDGCIWEVSIATISVSSSEVVTITDTRVFCAIPMQLTTNRITDANITHEKIADVTVDYTRLSAGLFPYTNVGDIAHLSATPGVLSRLAPTGIGDILVSGGVGVAPMFRANFAGAGISSVTPEVIPAGGSSAIELPTVDWDQGYWGTFITDGYSLAVPIGAAGLYLITGFVRWGVGADKELALHVGIFGIGTYPVLLNHELFGGVTSVDYICQTVSGLAYLSDTDHVSLSVTNGSPNNMDLLAKYLGLARLG
jgi:hypothetical protein